MKIVKKSALAAAVSVVIGLGIAGQAAASVYGGSRLSVQNLNIAINPAGGASVSSFTFFIEDAATLNGAPDGDSNNCFGTPAFNNCSAASPVLTVNAANAPGGTVNRVDGAANNFSFLGPGADQYANSDAQIDTAQLVQGILTSTRSISEFELQASGSAQASTNIQSNTNLVLTFTLAAPGDLTFDFEADPNLFVDISGIPNFFAGSAQANVAASFTLTQTQDGLPGNPGNGQDGSATWSPQGTAANDCNVGGGLACNELADSEDLNTTRGVGADNNSAGLSDNRSTDPDQGLQQYSIEITGLDAGNWSLSLDTTTSVSGFVQQVPEPETLMLLGMGLTAFGVAGLRRRKEHTA